MGTYRELSFFVNPLDWSQSLQTVTPMIGLVKNIFQLVGNGWDETTDLIFGEDNKKDKTPIGYYMSKMIPYVNPLARQLELFEEDKNVLYHLHPLFNTPGWTHNVSNKIDLEVLKNLELIDIK